MWDHGCVVVEDEADGFGSGVSAVDAEVSDLACVADGHCGAWIDDVVADSPEIGVVGQGRCVALDERISDRWRCLFELSPTHTTIVLLWGWIEHGFPYFRDSERSGRMGVMSIRMSVHAEGVTKIFGGNNRTAERVTVLRGISLSVAAGEMVAIVGPSGSGKSTLLYCLSGLEACTNGTVSLFDLPIGGMSGERLAQLRQDRVGFIFQAYNLIPSLSAWENVALPLRLGKRKFDRKAVDAALNAVGIADRAHHPPGELSGGQQQRVAIARVLAVGPEVVFADEPTGALDTQTGAEVLNLLRSLTGQGRSVVLVTHDLEAAALADRVLVLRDGLIHAELVQPTPELVLEAIERAKTVDLANPADSVRE